MFGATFVLLFVMGVLVFKIYHHEEFSGAELDWQLLGEFDYVTGQGPNTIMKLHGTPVKMPGFMVPLEDDSRFVKEFLLVPSPQACIHVPAPPPNQMVYVRMKKGARFEVAYGPIWVFGTLNITTKKSQYGDASYEILGDDIEPYK